VTQTVTAADAHTACRGRSMLTSYMSLLLARFCEQPHLAVRAKQDMANYMRQVEIDRGNSALLSRVSYLAKHKIMDDNAEAMQALCARLGRCRQSAKDFRAEKIQRENEV
jgi:hypothetical protein